MIGEGTHQTSQHPTGRKVEDRAQPSQDGWDFAEGSDGHAQRHIGNCASRKEEKPTQHSQDGAYRPWEDIPLHSMAE